MSFSEGVGVGSDAHWSGDVNNRKSTTGYYFKLNGQLGCQEAGHHGCFSFFRSRIPGVGSRSSESIVSEKTSGGFPHSTKTSSSNWRGQPELYQFTPKPIMVKRNKHMKTAYCFIKDMTEDGTISIHYVPTDKMAADISQKNLSCIEGGIMQNCFDEKKALLNQLNSEKSV